MANVRLEGIKRKFNKVTAIENITFEVPDGQFWVLVGPSGCGKSTVLRLIAGLETATGGNLYIGDVLVNDIPARQRDVAMVFQNYALYPHMTVAQNIAFGMEMRQVEPRIIRERVKTVARSLSLDHLLDRKPGQLSGGQQQRVALGRAIARQPKVFLLDEPLSNLDAQLRDDTRAQLKQLHHHIGITTIYVTHDQVEAMTLADQIVVLNKGRIQQIGEPQSIYARSKNRMVATFLGSPPMNILPATYTGTSFDLGGQFIPCTSAIKDKLPLIAGQNFDLGIRSEHIKILRQEARGERREVSAQLSVEVKLVELLGRETSLRVNLPETDIALNMQVTDICPSLGDRLFIQLNLNHLFIFDAATGETLYPL